MKREDLLRRLRQIAKERNEEFRVTEGGRHSRVWIGTQSEPVPRHNEIKEYLARGILKKFIEGGPSGR
jgi:mRNA interferase HicA